MEEKGELVVITGMSGAGKSSATNCFEDMDYYCIDNLPPGLMKNFLDLLIRTDSVIKKAAVVMDIRGGELFDGLMGEIETMDFHGVKYKMLFLEADKETILKRFSETRRMHPLAKNITNDEAIDIERRKLAPLKSAADMVIDTSKLKPAETAAKIRELFSNDEKGRFALTLESFGYKYGAPQDADFVFDVRFIPNPFYVESLKKLTGNDPAVAEYVLKDDEARRFVKEIFTMLMSLKTSFIREGKNHLTVAIGCTGGQHRSVTIANELYAEFCGAGEDVSLIHRELAGAAPAAEAYEA